MSRKPFALRFAHRADKTTHVGQLKHDDKVGGLVQLSDDELRNVSGGVEALAEESLAGGISFLKRTSEATYGNPGGNPDGTDTLKDFTVLDVQF